jgi:EmrB/QacA subfamily drug resistance transporter
VTPKPPCDEGVLRAGRCAAVSTPGVETRVLAAAILGSSLAFIDGTAVNVALPVLQAQLGATVGEAQWVVEIYTLFLASLVLVGGTLGDRLGRRRVFAWGIAVFAAASAACAVASSPAALIAARGVQGLGAAMLVPGSLALISASVPRERRGRAIGTWSGFTAIAGALGPVLGGWLAQNASWRWVFLLNLPVAAATLLVLRRVPESRDERPAALDLAGAALITLGLGAVVFGLIESQARGWSDPLVRSALVLGAAALAGFAVVEARSPSPMLPPAVFRSRTFSGANLLTLLLYAALSGALFFLPFNLIQVQGYSPTAAGASFVPLTVILFALSRWSGRLVDRFGGRRPLIVGPLLAAAGFALLARAGADYWTTVFPGTVVLGLGMALTVAPLTTVVMSAVPSNHAGLASGINNAVARTAGLLAIAALGIALVSEFDRALDRRLAGLELPTEVRATLERQRDRLAAAEVPASLTPATRLSVRDSIRASFLDGFRLVLGICAVLAGAAAACAWLLVEDAPSPMAAVADSR